MFDEQVQDIQIQMAAIVSGMRERMEEETGELPESVQAAFEWGKRQAEGWRLMRGARAVRQRVIRMKRAEDACQETIFKMREHAELEMRKARQEENQKSFSQDARVLNFN